MQSPLEKAESGIQDLIEKGLGRFSRSNLVTLLGQQMVSEIRDLTRDETGSLRLAPDHFVIHANAKTWDRLNKDPRWAEKCRVVVEKEVLSSGVTFQSPLRIDPVVDAKVDEREFQIECRWQSDTLHETRAMRTAAQNDPLQESAQSGGSLIVNGENFLLDQPVINIGRRESNDLVIQDARVSRTHAQVKISAGKATLYDLDSTGGTYVNNQRIRSRILKPGDVISLAGCLLIYNQDGDLSATDQVSAGNFNQGPSE